MKKVKCSVCTNEEASFCKIKKIKISLNKKRLCKDYIYDERKLKKKHDIKTVMIPFVQLEENKKKAKIERKKIQKIVEQQKMNTSTELLYDFDKSNVKHPVTGDLSRFVSSGSKSMEDADGN